jgi:hypothetical protein
MAELVGGEPSAGAGRRGGSVQLLASGGGLPMPSGGRAVDHAQQRADRQLASGLEPGLELCPRPAVHVDLAALAALAFADEDRAPVLVQVALLQSERLTDPQTGAPQKHDQRT